MILLSPMRMRMTCVRYKLSDIDRVVMKTSISFDMSIFEIFWALTTGSALVIVKQREELNADSIHNAERKILKILLRPSF
jgi:non-ribosomal peptide synthetase component F